MNFSQQEQSNKSTSYKYNPNEDSGNGFPIEPPRVNYKNVHSQSVMHPNAAAGNYRKMKADPSHSVHARHAELTTQDSQARKSMADSSDYLQNDVQRRLNNDSTASFSEHSYSYPRILCHMF